MPIAEGFTGPTVAATLYHHGEARALEALLAAQYNGFMASTDSKTRGKLYLGADVPLRVIRDFARKVAAQFRPEKIILFGSHAYGTPHAGSDVDILVIMPARNELDQSFKIRLAIPAPFPMDLIVRTPQKILSRLERGDSFHTEIVTKGKVLYAKGDAGVGAKGGRRFSGVRRSGKRAGSTP